MFSHPDIREVPIEELEALVTTKRHKRLSLVFQHQQLEAARASKVFDKADTAVFKQMTILERDLVKIDELIHKCSDRIIRINLLKNDISQASAIIDAYDPNEETQ